MRLFRKRHEPANEREIVGTEQCHQIVKEWCAADADYRYYLREGNMLVWDDGTKTLKTMYGEGDGLRHINGWYGYASGNKAWAEKNAAHFGIEIQEGAES